MSRLHSCLSIHLYHAQAFFLPLHISIHLLSKTLFILYIHPIRGFPHNLIPFTSKPVVIFTNRSSFILSTSPNHFNTLYYAQLANFLITSSLSNFLISHLVHSFHSTHIPQYLISIPFHLVFTIPKFHASP